MASNDLPSERVDNIRPHPVKLLNGPPKDGQNKEDASEKVDAKISCCFSSHSMTPKGCLSSRCDWEAINSAYFGRQYKPPDVLIVSGSIIILIGIGVLVIGVYLLLERRQSADSPFASHQYKDFVLIFGLSMVTFGLLMFCLRITCWKPRIFSCLCPECKPRRKKKPVDPPIFTAASSALSAITTVGVRYSRGSLDDAAGARRYSHPFAIKTPTQSFNGLGKAGWDATFVENRPSPRTTDEPRESPPKQLFNYNKWVIGWKEMRNKVKWKRRKSNGVKVNFSTKVTRSRVIGLSPALNSIKSRNSKTTLDLDFADKDLISSILTQMRKKSAH